MFAAITTLHFVRLLSSLGQFCYPHALIDEGSITADNKVKGYVFVVVQLYKVNSRLRFWQDFL